MSILTIQETQVSPVPAYIDLRPASISSNGQETLIFPEQQQQATEAAALIEARLRHLTTLVEEFEEFDELLNLRASGCGTKKERTERERRYRLLESRLFAGADWCADGVLDKALEDVRSCATELDVDYGEVQELLRRIDAVAENMSDE